ncbi:MAG: hypothetical protein V1743_03150 [Nanoarchaeota archaeon]
MAKKVLLKNKEINRQTYLYLLSVIAIVAIVGIVVIVATARTAMLKESNSESYYIPIENTAADTTAPANIAGEAGVKVPRPSKFKTVGQAANAVSGESVLNAQMQAYIASAKAESATIEKETLPAPLNAPLFAKHAATAGATLTQADLPLQGCLQLSQSYFNGLTGDAVFSAPSGCIELAEDINFEYTIVVKDGSDGFYLDCKYHKVTGSNDYEGIEVEDETQVKNCAVEGKFNGFFVTDYGTVEDSTSKNNLYDGFVINAHGKVYRSTAEDNAEGGGYGQFGYGNGFRIMDAGSVEYSKSRGNLNGFYLSEDATVKNSQAYNNRDYGVLTYGSTADPNPRTQVDDIVVTGSAHGFDLMGYAKANRCNATGNTVTGFTLWGAAEVYDSTAYKNKNGFRLLNTAKLYSSQARNNTEYGVIIEGTGYAAYATAVGNAIAGFSIYNAGIVKNSLAEGNSIGYKFYGSSRGEGLRAERNAFNGFMAFDSAKLVGGIATNNGLSQSDYGIILDGYANASSFTSSNNKNGIYVPANAYAETGVTCSNEYEDIMVNGGTLRKTFKTTNHEEPSGMGDWTLATFTDCVSSPPPTSSPIMLKSSSPTVMKTAMQQK